MKTDSIVIRLDTIRLHGCHGLSDMERQVGSDFTLDIALHIEAGADDLLSDDIGRTVNYAEVYTVAKAEFLQPSRLIERVAARIAQSVLDRFPLVISVDISLAKLRPPFPADCRAASVSLTARRD